MQATIVDLRYRMKDVLAAINRNEEITVLYHNKKIATLIPLQKKNKSSVKSHAFYGMLREEKSSVVEQMDRLRGGRYK